MDHIIKEPVNESHDTAENKDGKKGKYFGKSLSKSTDLLILLI